jgi:hypothetical protein
MLQHAPNDAVGAMTVLNNLFEIATQRPNCLEYLDTSVGGERADRASGRWLELKGCSFLVVIPSGFFG